MDEQTEERFDRATAVVQEFIAEIRTLTGSNFPNELGWSIADVFIAAGSLGEHPLIRRFEPIPGCPFFEVDDWLGNYIAGGMHEVETLHEVFRIICINNIAARKPVPEPFISSIIALLDGQKIQPARKPGAKKSQDILPWLIVMAAFYVRDAFDLKIVRSDASESHSASDAVVMVLQSYGYDLKYTRLRDWCTKREHAELRRSADLLSGIYDSRYLFELGVLKHWKPFVAILELART